MNPNQPLGLPRGSVRALLALFLVVLVGAGYLWKGSIDGKDVVALATLALGFYFMTRSTGGNA